MPVYETGEGQVYLGAAAGGDVPVDFVPVAREWTRILIAGGLVALLTLTIVASFWYVNWHLGTAADREGLLNVIFTPLIGLLGAVTGFYFGERKGDGD
jgi:hypothetical protein